VFEQPEFGRDFRYGVAVAGSVVTPRSLIAFPAGTAVTRFRFRFRITFAPTVTTIPVPVVLRLVQRRPASGAGRSGEGLT
jgi:ABC-type glycerol-3-phosphate transport system permease component